MACFPDILFPSSDILFLSKRSPTLYRLFLGFKFAWAPVSIYFPMVTNDIKRTKPQLLHLRLIVVIAVHLQSQRSYQCVAAITATQERASKISDGRESRIMEGQPPKLSFTGRNVTAKTVTSRLYPREVVDEWLRALPWKQKCFSLEEKKEEGTPAVERDQVAPPVVSFLLSCSVSAILLVNWTEGDQSRRWNNQNSLKRPRLWVSRCACQPSSVYLVLCTYAVAACQADARISARLCDDCCGRAHIADVRYNGFAVVEKGATPSVGAHIELANPPGISSGGWVLVGTPPFLLPLPLATSSLFQSISRLLLDRFTGVHGQYERCSVVDITCVHRAQRARFDCQFSQRMRSSRGFRERGHDASAEDLLWLPAYLTKF
ncbi:hypothetical protein EVAR_97561_1 [Eumeta japonica]|uniref:Uncharacterized protein n=1 Tax=Eumeta variegata TaxID=151549 RepID=A0A4C1WNL8_EUMVA|nr:hypothetical protein EVAR_97561_1 [Eumeta japonica]